MIYPQGSVNPTALIVPDVAVVILPPDQTVLNGAPTNIVGVIGTASWGPVNSPAIVGSMGDYAKLFGPVKARKYDLGTVVMAAVLQGANNFRCVRATDGTDAAATIVVQTSCITFTSKYTGSAANGDTVTIANGSQPGTFKATVLRPGQTPEVFDNIALGLTANAIWVAIAAAINSGQGNGRGPSELVVATAGVGTAAPTLATYTLAAGADGAGSIVPATHLVGVDTAGARTGMYALRSTKASIGVLADCDVSSTWTTQTAFGISEGVYMIMVAAAGIAIANGSTGVVDLKAAAGIDSPWSKILHGDWPTINDAVNNVQRMISPQGFSAGLLGNLAPQDSSLNKQVYGIVGTQRTLANQVYSYAELQALGAAGIDLITNPIPAGNQFGVRFGCNTSSQRVTHQDTYTRMTNFLAATFNAGLGIFVGKNQSPAVRRQAQSTLGSFLDVLWFQHMIGNAEGTLPYSVQIDAGNNPSPQVAGGIMQANVRVQYLSVIETFLVNLMGGQSVQIQRLSTLPA